MKQLLLLMAIVGLATTGCAQNRVLGTHARRGGASMQIAQTKNTQGARTQARFDQQEENIELASYGAGGRCRGGDCDNGSCASDACCNSGNCNSGNCGSDSCSSANCSDKCNLRERVASRFSGCSNCDGSGCGLCQRVAGRLRGMNPNPHAGGYPAGQNFNPSQPTGQIAYPYYTTRGPRDFLNRNPPSIGPY